MPCIKLIRKIKHSPLFKRTIYDYRKLDVEKLSNELSNVRWMDIISLHSIEEAAQLFPDTLYNTVKTCMPVKTISVRQCDKPWTTEEIKQMIRNKNKLHKKEKKKKKRKKLKHLIPTSRGKALDKSGTT